MVEIARSINFLWTESKSTDYSSDADRERLRNALGYIREYVLPNARQNPLNLVLLAYETLWRVALFCFLEVTFRQGPRPNGNRSLVTFSLTRPRYALRNAGQVPVPYPQLTSSTRCSGPILQQNMSIASSTWLENGPQDCSCQRRSLSSDSCHLGR